tara:strand:- start:274 stop:762 length:489 start_codon:yes stop_codon:yes gene_type:complete
MSRPYLPAGVYIISDPCYVFSDNDYDRLIEQTGFFGLYNRDGTTNDKNNQGGTFVLGWDREQRKQPFAAWSTLHGDGGYRGTDGNIYSVDAGLIACIPLAICDSEQLKHGLGEHYHIHTFKKDFICESYNGTLSFGDVTIYTGDDPEDSCEWCDELMEDCEC